MSRRSDSFKDIKLARRWSVVKRILSWIRTEFISAAGPVSRVTHLVERLERVIRHMGLKGAMKWIKIHRNVFLQFLSVLPGSFHERKLKRKLRQVWGYGGAAGLLKRDPSDIRMALTVFTALRSFTLPVEIDLTPILNPSTRTDCGSWKPHVKPFWALLEKLRRVPNASTLDWSEYHFSLKAGPSGGPAILGAMKDLASLPESLIRHLKVIGGEPFEKTLDGAMEGLGLVSGVSTRLFTSEGNGVIRRIQGIPDKEGKTRVIAILDYWSQTALRPLHL
jgi:hypothetical protein